MRDRILLIDDEANLRMILEATLQRGGFDVQAFESFTAAKLALDTQDFDVVLTDLQMPEASGMEVLAYCRSYSPDLPVILITAFGTVERAVSAMQMGAFDFILKPFQNDELFRVLSKATESRIRRRREPASDLMSALGVGPVPIPLFGASRVAGMLREGVERASRGAARCCCWERSEPESAASPGRSTAGRIVRAAPSSRFMQRRSPRCSRQASCSGSRRAPIPPISSRSPAPWSSPPEGPCSSKMWTRLHPRYRTGSSPCSRTSFFRGSGCSAFPDRLPDHHHELQGFRRADPGVAVPCGAVLQARFRGDPSQPVAGEKGRSRKRLRAILH